MSLFVSGLMVKNSSVVGRSSPITTGMTAGTGLALSNPGKRTAKVQLVRTDVGVVPPDSEPRDAADVDLYGQWLISPGEAIFEGIDEYALSAVEYGGLYDYTLLLFADGPAAIAYTFRGEAA